MGEAAAEIERLRARVAELEVQLEQSRSLGKLGGYPCTPEHTWAEWLADRNKRVAELEAAQEWRPIESAPKDGAAFLAVDARSQSHRVVWFDDEAKPPFVWHVDDASGWFNHHADFFTHWLPLPAPPKEVT